MHVLQHLCHRCQAWTGIGQFGNLKDRFLQKDFLLHLSSPVHVTLTCPHHSRTSTNTISLISGKCRIVWRKSKWWDKCYDPRFYAFKIAEVILCVRVCVCNLHFSFSFLSFCFEFYIFINFVYYNIIVPLHPFFFSLQISLYTPSCLFSNSWPVFSVIIAT